MTVSTDGLQEVAVGRNTRYFSKNGKQIAVTELISIDLSTLPLLDDITRVEVNNDNIVRLLSIVTVKGHFAGYRMKRLYQLGCYSPVSSMKGEVKEMLLAFIQETVEYLHQTAHIYHCDIRLSNIMVNGQGQLKLIDFDIAQTDVFATPDAGVPEAQFFLSVSRRLDHLDIKKPTSNARTGY
ncbi:hypothetical protein AJ79_01095 [Helicocarpus griseus UAMH5409]|uniref:EKC/KEOPS complex subunit BUD32 n=1 Tax=Helicocarpus griseus UAMH5409 TaxID=1447875 RepID=A0A2B7Y8D2_9EURO|nr:hypothetical protein AJ79_01095 [Helicocarpus griseus UAMH5409]